VSKAWGNEDVQGYSVALGVVSLLFFIRAASVEFATTNVHEAQRDIIWGLSLGAFLSMLSKLTS
jgi:hypothetical protein